jgi:hypothetical protein
MLMSRILQQQDKAFFGDSYIVNKNITLLEYYKFLLLRKVIATLLSIYSWYLSAMANDVNGKSMIMFTYHNCHT